MCFKQKWIKCKQKKKKAVVFVLFYFQTKTFYNDKKIIGMHCVVIKNFKKRNRIMIL